MTNKQLQHLKTLLIEAIDSPEDSDLGEWGCKVIVIEHFTNDQLSILRDMILSYKKEAQ
jgi:hypothetical protein